MNPLTRVAVRRKVATAAVACALAVLGVLSVTRLPVDFLPDIAYPLVKVHVWWSGATPEEIEEHVAEVIEREAASVEGLDYLESSSTEGSYTLQVNFRYGVDVNVAFQDVQAAMARAARRLPRDMDAPIVVKADPQQLPVVQLTVQSSRWGPVETREWTENWLVDRVLSVPGVSGAETIGGWKREIRVHVDPITLDKHDLSAADIERVLAEANVEMFAGRVYAGPQEIIARTMGELESLDAIRSLVVDRRDGKNVYLRDVAEVLDGHEEVRMVTRLDGHPCVKMSVQKQPDANTVAVAEAVQARLDSLGPSIADHVHLGMVENQATYVEGALTSVKTSAMQAAVLVLLVTLLFLGSLRQALILLLALPVTLLGTLAGMHFAGFSLNIFTLAGIVIALGVVLDNAIVVVENISRREPSAAANRDSDAMHATGEVTTAVIAGTSTLLALFLPYLFVSGITSLLFRELILVVAGVVLISLIGALTVVPMLGALLVRHSPASRALRWQAWISDRYGRFLARVLRVRWLVVLAFAGVIGLAVAAVPSVGTEFLPRLDDGRVMVKVRLPTGAAVTETDALIQRIEAELAEDSRIVSAFTLAGGKVWGLYTFEVANEGQIEIQLVPPEQREISTQAYVRKLHGKLKRLAPAGGKVMVRQMRVKGIRKMGQSDLEIQIRGPDMERLFPLAREAAAIAQQAPYLANVHLGMDMTKPELLVRIDRVRAAALGISVRRVAHTLRALLHGVVATRYQDGSELYDIRLRIPEERITSKRQVENLVLSARESGKVRLRDVATVTEGTGPVEIIRENQVKQVVVLADAWQASVGKSLQQIQRDIQGVDLPPGYEIHYGGKARLMQDLGQTTVGILGLAVFLALVVLAVQFNSVRYPIVILCCIPASAAGMVFALWATNLAMGATVLVGLLVVLAATVQDGVLLFTLANELRGQEDCETAAEAIREAARRRLRPRVMTTVTTIAGLSPLAFGLGTGGDMLQPMAVGAMGGLLFEIPVALLLMPSVYVLAAWRRRPA